MIRLTREDARFMTGTLDLPAGLRSMLRNPKRESALFVSDDDADRLRDLCTDRFDTHGLDRDYELTNEGRRLDALIDKLYVG